MGDADVRLNFIAATSVLGLAVVALLSGTLGSSNSTTPSEPAGIPSPADAATHGTPGAAMPLDPQPEVVIQHVAFTLSQPFDTPEATALLGLLGGSDPAYSGVVLADTDLDDMSIQRAVRGVPGAKMLGVMGVITRGGESAGIGVEMTQTDPITGVTVGRRELVVLTTVTMLQDGRLAVWASLRDEADSTALAVIGRRVGVPLGRTGEVHDALILDPEQRAAIRLPGRELGVVFLQIHAPTSPVQPVGTGVRPAGEPSAPSTNSNGG